MLHLFTWYPDHETFPPGLNLKIVTSLPLPPQLLRPVVIKDGVEHTRAIKPQ